MSVAPGSRFSLPWGIWYGSDNPGEAQPVMEPHLAAKSSLVSGVGLEGGLPTSALQYMDGGGDQVILFYRPVQ